MVQRRSNGFGQLRDEVDRVLGDFFGGSAFGRPAEERAYPTLNVWEKGDEVVVEAEMPGLNEDDLEISVVSNELSIRGRRPQFEEEGVAYHRRERGFGEFNRRLRLPVDVDANKVNAVLKDGVLTITLPKAEASKPRKIQVTSAKQ